MPFLPRCRSKANHKQLQHLKEKSKQKRSFVAEMSHQQRKQQRLQYFKHYYITLKQNWSTTDAKLLRMTTGWLVGWARFNVPLDTVWVILETMFLQVRWPTQQCQSSVGGWLVIQIALNLTGLISPWRQEPSRLKCMLHRQLHIDKTEQQWTNSPGRSTGMVT